MGIHGDRLVFLHRDGWVCSANAANFDVEKYTRHLVFPTDWLGAESAFTAKVSPNGLVSMIRGEEVAIVENGLEHCDSYQTISSSKSGSFSSRKSSIFYSWRTIEKNNTADHR